MRLNPLFSVSVALGVSACTEQIPSEPSVGTTPEMRVSKTYTLSDAHHGGNPHFYFLPPIASAPHSMGTFDPTLAPTVRVCVLPDCTSDIATFVTGDGPGQVRVTGGAYQVLWHTKSTGLVVDGQYRIRVYVGLQLLGFLDIRIVPKRGPRTALTGDLVPVRQRQPLLIRFRIEEDAIQQPIIAFSGSRNFTDSEVFLMNADGTGRTNITNHPAGDFQPAWSPNGSSLAFTSTRAVDGSRDIWVMNRDGTGPAQLTTDPATDQGATWSPDGTQIAFVSERDGNQDIYVMHADGTNQTRLTNDPERDDYPDWSPDGSKIAFMSMRDGNAHIYVMNADGTNQMKLTSGSRPAVTPAWSPDGTKIAFTSDDVLDGFVTALDIYVMNADGSGRTRLTDDEANDSDPSWSADGNKIAFVSERAIATGHLEIFAMNADGSGEVNLTNDPGEDVSPDWSPF